jgi:hypothetical protein
MMQCNLDPKVRLSSSQPKAVSDLFEHAYVYVLLRADLSDEAC